MSDRVTDARVHGVLLAAGTSNRFGERNKLLARVDGEPIVCHAARSLLSAHVEAVTVVLGHEHRRVRDALEHRCVRDALSDAADPCSAESSAGGTEASTPPMTFVRAEDYAEGQSRSLRRGIEAVRARDPVPDAVVIALGDMPEVSPESIDRLIAAYESGTGSALAAAYEGQRGNPVLFDATHFEKLAATDGDTGGRSILLNAADAALVETGDPGVVRDVDRPEDLPR